MVRWTSGARRAGRSWTSGRTRGDCSAAPGAGRPPPRGPPGAVYLHQGDSYFVDSLDIEDGIAFVHAEDPGYATFAREITDIQVTGSGERSTFGPVTLGV